jgi:hypothetical protein
VVAFGKLLDRTRWSQTKRAWISFACWLIPQAACFIWIGVEYAKFGRGKLEDALDYEKYDFPVSCLALITNGYSLKATPGDGSRPTSHT